MVSRSAARVIRADEKPAGDRWPAPVRQVAPDSWNTAFKRDDDGAAEGSYVYASGGGGRREERIIIIKTNNNRGHLLLDVLITIILLFSRAAGTHVTSSHGSSLEGTIDFWSTKQGTGRLYSISPPPAMAPNAMIFLKLSAVLRLVVCAKH